MQLLKGERQVITTTLFQKLSAESELLFASDLKNPFLKKLKKILEQEYADPEFNAAKLYLALHLSPMQAHRNVKKLTGLTPRQCILCFRLHKALSLLLTEPYLSCGEISYQAGFKYHSNFTTVFRSYFKRTPLQVKVTVNS